MSEGDRQRNQNAIELLTAMTVEELSKELDRSPSDMMADFLLSRTARILYSEDTKLWWDGPSAVADMYLAENGLTPDISRQDS